MKAADPNHPHLSDRATSCVFSLSRFPQPEEEESEKSFNLRFIIICEVGKCLLLCSQVPTLTMRDRVTVSMRPLSGTLTISLSHDRWDGTASALTVTFITPTKITNYVRMEQFWFQLCGRVFDGD